MPRAGRRYLAAVTAEGSLHHLAFGIFPHLYLQIEVRRRYAGSFSHKHRAPYRVFEFTDDDLGTYLGYDFSGEYQNSRAYLTGINVNGEPNPVPEPGSLALLSLGLLGLGAARRYRACRQIGWAAAALAPRVGSSPPDFSTQ